MGQFKQACGEKGRIHQVPTGDSTRIFSDCVGARREQPLFPLLISGLVQESSPLPVVHARGLEAGPWKGWTGSMDVVAPKGETVHLALGAEYRLSVVNEISSALRGGYNSRQSTGGSAEGLSAGLGFGWRKLVVDYAFVSHGDLDPGQVLSIGYEF